MENKNSPAFYIVALGPGVSLELFESRAYVAAS